MLPFIKGAMVMVSLHNQRMGTKTMTLYSFLKQHHSEEIPAPTAHGQLLSLEQLLLHVTRVLPARPSLCGSLL